MKTLRMEVGGRDVELLVAKSLNGTLWVHLNGETFTYEPPRAKSRAAKGSVAKGNEIVAPMPGKIVKIQTQKGEKVAAGQVLVVMEAMKMEYTLKAHAEANVGDILVSVGDQVALGQRLVVMDT